MAKSEIKCEYAQNGNCKSVMENAEAKEARRTACNNDNEQAYCYLCDYYHGCEINCTFLGENKRKPDRTEKQQLPPKKSVLRCPLCDSKMLHTNINLRIGGWTGIMQLVPFGGLGELGQELLPVKLYICPKCGKLELMAQEKAKQAIINR